MNKNNQVLAVEGPNASMEAWKRSAIRVVLAAGAGVLAGVLLHGSSVFIPTIVASQFMTGSLTGGLFYAALKETTLRNSIAALFVWYVLLTSLVGYLAGGAYNWWPYVLNAAYMVSLAAGVYLYLYGVRRGILRGIAQRVAALGVLTAIMNAVTILFLSLFSIWWTIRHPGEAAHFALRNLQIGTLMGLAIGLGIELAEYVIGGFAAVGGGEEEGEGDMGATVICPSCGQGLELSSYELEFHEYICPVCGKAAHV